ncbi:MAG: hypothetical protein BJ554DRAFT_7010, partial [Olpidium bornovanus]
MELRHLYVRETQLHQLRTLPGCHRSAPLPVYGQVDIKPLDIQKVTRGRWPRREGRRCEVYPRVYEAWRVRAKPGRPRKSLDRPADLGLRVFLLQRRSEYACRTGKYASRFPGIPPSAEYFDLKSLRNLDAKGRRRLDIEGVLLIVEAPVVLTPHFKRFSSKSPLKCSSTDWPVITDALPVAPISPIPTLHQGASGSACNDFASTCPTNRQPRWAGRGASKRPRRWAGRLPRGGIETPLGSAPTGEIALRPHPNKHHNKQTLPLPPPSAACRAASAAFGRLPRRFRRLRPPAAPSAPPASACRAASAAFGRPPRPLRRL